MILSSDKLLNLTQVSSLKECLQGKSLKIRDQVCVLSRDSKRPINKLQMTNRTSLRNLYSCCSTGHKRFAVKLGKIRKWGKICNCCKAREDLNEGVNATGVQHGVTPNGGKTGDQNGHVSVKGGKT